jgi:hypothetical protein
VRAGEDGETDHIDVFLDGGGGDHLGSLMEAGVDDLHAGVAEGSGDDLGATVMAIETGLCDEYADGTGHGRKLARGPPGFNAESVSRRAGRR